MKNWILQNKKVILQSARVIIILLVTGGLIYAFQKAANDLQREQFDWRMINWPWLLATSGFYLAAMLCSWFYWHRVLVGMHQSPAWQRSLQAFIIGQLGKYVPGKAMVVVLRASLVQDDFNGEQKSTSNDSELNPNTSQVVAVEKETEGSKTESDVRTSVAALAVFVETLTYMAAGAFIAALFLPFIAPDQNGLIGLSIVLVICAGIPTFPPFFRKIVRFLRLGKLDAKVEPAIAGLNFRMLAQGWILSAFAWLLNGASLFAVLKSLAGVSPEFSDLPLMIACASLAAVAGFVSLLPGGLGVRELVLIPLLSPFGIAKALIAAILLRAVWMLTELLASTILYVWRRASTVRATAN